MSGRDPSLPPILPVGTAVISRTEVRSRGGEVVLPLGAVGVIVSAPADLEHPYRVRFAGGEEASLRRRELHVLKHFQRPDGAADSDAMAEYDLGQFVIYRCVVGSRAYGLERDSSDTDRRGVYLPPAELHWSLLGVPEQIEYPVGQEVYWELQKCLTLALRANPNVLEVLYSPLVEHAAPIAQELLAMRAAFLSRMVYQTYNGYVLSQFKKMEADLRHKGAIKSKHAMHLIRLLLAGITVLREGFVPVRVEDHREALLAIRDGTMSWDEVNAWRSELHRRFDKAYASTRLPERPDYAKANALLIQARRSMVR